MDKYDMYDMYNMYHFYLKIADFNPFLNILKPVENQSLCLRQSEAPKSI